MNRTNRDARPTAADDDDSAGLEMEVYNNGGVIFRTTAIAPGVEPRYKLNRLTQHRPAIASLDGAIAHVNRPRPDRILPGRPDDHVEMRAHFTLHRKRIYNAMVILPSDVDANQESQWDQYELALRQGLFDFKDIEAKSWILTDEIIKLHERPINLSDMSNENLNFFYERDLSCSARMMTILDFLYYNKSICLDLMTSSLLLYRFVATPKAVMSQRPGVKIGYRHSFAVTAGRSLNAANAPAAPQVLAGQSEPAPRVSQGPQNRSASSAAPKLPPPTAKGASQTRVPGTHGRDDFTKAGTRADPVQIYEDDDAPQNSTAVISKVAAGSPGEGPARKKRRTGEKEEQEEAGTQEATEKFEESEEVGGNNPEEN